MAGRTTCGTIKREYGKCNWTSSSNLGRCLNCSRYTNGDCRTNRPHAPATIHKRSISGKNDSRQKVAAENVSVVQTAVQTNIAAVYDPNMPWTRWKAWKAIPNIR